MWWPNLVPLTLVMRTWIVVSSYDLYLTRVVFDGGAEDVYILQGSTHAIDAKASCITTGTTAPPLFGFSC
jgi:hypothetical protein